jgi:hypothetical protein
MLTLGFLLFGPGSTEGLQQLYAEPLRAAEHEWGLLSPDRQQVAVTVVQRPVAGFSACPTAPAGSSSRGLGPGEVVAAHAMAMGGGSVRSISTSGADAHAVPALHVDELGSEQWVQDDSPSSQARLVASLPRGILLRVARRLGLPLRGWGQAEGGGLGSMHSGSSSSSSSSRGSRLSEGGTPALLAARASEARLPHLLAPAVPGGGGGLDVGLAAAVARHVAGGVSSLPLPRELVQRAVRESIAGVVAASSARQAVAAALSAGVLKSVRYALAKVRKARWSN